MIVTTAGRTNIDMIEKAIGIASSLQIPFIHRKKRSITTIQNDIQDDCLVVGKDRLEIFPMGESIPIFFHPNSSMFRIKRIIQGEKDPFIIASCIKEGKTLLDCTFGLGSDSITASFVVGENGLITGCEGNPFLAYIINDGLSTWSEGTPEMIKAMRRIKLMPVKALDYLKSLPDCCYDCVYLDPMFDEKILESDGIRGIRRLAVYDTLDEETIYHAVRVAKERVVLKDHYRSLRFSHFGFNVQVRKTAKFHFGILLKEHSF